MGDTNAMDNRFPRDLLQRFMGRGCEFEGVKKEEDSDSGETEIELNLGLSLGGRFGLDKACSNRLVRSSSVAGPIPIVRETEVDGVLPVSLGRTSSLPVETEDEWRKRKEMQCLRRMEAKRRRSEKQRVFKNEKDGFVVEREEYVAAMNKVGSSVAPPFVDAGAGLKGFVRPLSQGSLESLGGSSSGISELENKSVQGSSSCGEVSPASIHSLQEQSSQDGVGSSGAKTSKKESKLAGAEMKSPSKETGMNSLQDMPCVFTKGEGPNGSRIEGILYKYGKGEEVRIMCVCHGIFYSPAGFVKHAGGSDVAHPLKHIVVNPNSCC